MATGAPELSSDLVPAGDELFFSRGDPNDPRLGDVVLRSPADYEAAEVVTIGCPQDEGVLRNGGRPGASRAPSQIRRALYRYPVTGGLDGLKLLDAGDIRLAATLEETHEALYRTVRRFLSDGKTVVVLGGGNDISYPDCCALAAEVDRPLILNIDRHLDVRKDTRRNSGTAYRQLLDEGVVEPSMFHEIGINSFANSQTYLEWAKDLGVHVHDLADLRDRGVGPLVRSVVEDSEADGVFFGFDMDVVRAVEAPGVSDPGPMGLTAREVCEIADVAASDPRTRVVEITEVNPVFDRDNLTSRLAANIIVRSLSRRTRRVG